MCILIYRPFSYPLSTLILFGKHMFIVHWQVQGYLQRRRKRQFSQRENKGESEVETSRKQKVSHHYTQ